MPMLTCIHGIFELPNAYSIPVYMGLPNVQIGKISKALYPSSITYLQSTPHYIKSTLGSNGVLHATSVFQQEYHIMEGV